MLDVFAQQISIFRSHIKTRRFNEATLQVLESVSVSISMMSLKEVQSSLRAFLRSESLSVIREIAEKPIEQKLLILEFLVRAFALIGDVESCLALRYEALHMRELRSTSCQWLQVSHLEWLNFAEHSLDNGFYSIAGKACENALLCFKRNDIANPKTDELFENIQVFEKIKRLKDFALTSAAAGSVQAQAAEYLKKKATEKSLTHSSLCKDTKCVASTLFRNGIKKRNVRTFHDLKRTNSESHIIKL